MLRGAGEVGCAHCTLIGADQPCQVCTRLVCAKCAADWATCSEPSGRAVRLGMAARVRDIDPLCRYALVSHWRRPLRLFDLRALRWVPDVEWERSLYVFARKTPPRLTARGELIHCDWSPIAGEASVFYGLKARAIATGHERSLPRLTDDAPDHGTAVSSTGDLFHYVSQTQRVFVFAPDGAAVSYEPLPRKVVQAIDLDGERGLLASASWGEIALHRIDGTTAMRLAHSATAREANVRWIGISGSRLVAATASWNETFVEVHELDAALSLHPGRRFTFSGELRVAALSRDGRYFAGSSGDQLIVFDLETGSQQAFSEHTDAINAVRFGAEDHVLVSADTDNRVILRPRTPSGYAKPLLAVKVA